MDHRIFSLGLPKADFPASAEVILAMFLRLSMMVLNVWMEIRRQNLAQPSARHWVEPEIHQLMDEWH